MHTSQHFIQVLNRKKKEISTGPYLAKGPGGSDTRNKLQVLQQYSEGKVLLPPLLLKPLTAYLSQSTRESTFYPSFLPTISQPLGTKTLFSALFQLGCLNRLDTSIISLMYSTFTQHPHTRCDLRLWLYSF